MHVFMDIIRRIFYTEQWLSRQFSGSAEISREAKLLKGFGLGIKATSAGRSGL